MKQFLATVAAVTIALPAFADQVEFDADMQFYGQTVYEHEACKVEIVRVDPGVEKIYIGDQMIAIITIVSDELAYVESYTDGLLVGEYSYQPNDEQSVMERDGHIDDLLDAWGVPSMSDQADPLSCLMA